MKFQADASKIDLIKALKLKMEFGVKQFPKIRLDSGFTLVELLVSIAVSGIVLAGLVSVFTTTNWAYTRQDETATLQQNLRVAKMSLERDIRMAGCGFGTAFNYINNPNPIPPLLNTDPIPPLLNSNSGGEANSDILTISYVNYSDPCNGILSQTLTTADLPDGALWWNASISTCKTAGVPFLAIYTRLVEPLQSTRRVSDLITVTGVGAGNVLQQTGLISGLVANSSIDFFSPTQLVTITYSYDSVNRTLIRNQQPANLIGAIAENIEDFQLAFGLDSNGDGVVDTAEWVNNQTLNATQRNNIRQVRVSILGRSTNPIRGHGLNARPAIEDNGAGAVQDRNLRQLLQFDVAVRNMM